MENSAIINVMTVKNGAKPNLGEIIKTTRKLAGLSQIDLAERAGVGKTLVFNLEKGSTQISFENILKVLKVLNIKLDFKLPFHHGNEE
jgi:transcriptional regulator with XRE-family HTH domain